MFKIPAVHTVLENEQIKLLLKKYPRDVVVDGIRYASAAFRKRKTETVLEMDEIIAVTTNYVEKKFAPSLKRTINATGTVIHTNLGRAKLSSSVQEALLEAAMSFSNLEYDLEKGVRGSRYQHLEEAICDLTGAEAALVVNNNAAAVMLALGALAKGKEVIVSRGELVEIGGSFRVPEVMELSGCTLREVGTTNKTHPYDYERHITEETGALLKVHTSNYKITGFTKEVTVGEMATISKEANIPLIHDMGSGMLFRLEAYGYPYEMTVQESLEAGADIVTFSGDKVLGGPQAGIIVGKKSYIEKMKKHPLTRALRVDKMTIATLEATFRLYYDKEIAFSTIPTLRMLVEDEESLTTRANQLAEMLSAISEKADIQVVDTFSQVGGGAYPGEEMKSKGVAIAPESQSVNKLAESLRHREIPIILKIQDDKCILDIRTIETEEFSIIAQALEEVL